METRVCSSSVLSSCEPELQELMRQIDIMMSQQKRQWEAEIQALQLRVRRGEDELSACRRLSEGREQEVQQLILYSFQMQTGQWCFSASVERDCFLHVHVLLKT